jgi:hypothetical protein
MPSSPGTFTKPTAITPTAMTVIAAIVASWIHTGRDKRTI